MLVQQRSVLLLNVFTKIYFYTLTDYRFIVFYFFTYMHTETQSIGNRTSE